MQLVSIIVPVYKVEKYLEKCVNSILHQTYQNIEIILVDDGSPDNSGKLCEKLKSKDSRIIVLHKDNGGLSDARNYGLQYAHGSLVMFVDSDDYIHTNMVEIMYEKMNLDGTDLVICDYCKVDQFGKLLENRNEKDIESKIVNSDEMLNILCTEQGWHFVPAWNKLYKRKIWDELLFPEGKLHEDEYVIHKVIEKCKKISIIGDKLYYYVQRNGSIMNTITDRNRLDGTEALLERTEFLLKYDKIEQATFCFEGAINKMLMNVKLEDKEREKKILLKMKNLYTYNSKLLNNRNDKLKYIILQKASKAYYMIFKLRAARRTLLAIKRNNYIKRKFVQLKLNIIFKMNHKKGTRCAVLMSTPIHGNLGDQAIVYAEYGFLKQCGINNIIEVDRFSYENCKTVIQRLVKKNDLIVVCGGGNMGSLWPEEDDIIREIVNIYNMNQIVIFPQTCYYDQTLESKRRLEKNFFTYSKCEQLTVALRDEKSYSFFRKKFPGIRSILVPDIVLSCEPKMKKQERKDILLCFRNDIEKNITGEALKNIKKMLENNSLTYKFTDTVVKKYIYKSRREKILRNKWNEFETAKLVITDRLHGMIFSVITQTPCIAINNVNGKVGHVYSKWLNTFPSVICVDEKSVNIELINQIAKNTDYKIPSMSDDFRALKECIINNCDEC